MFHLHYDTKLDRLADRLAGLLAARDPALLLEPQTVLVPQQGVQRWLVQRLAERHGIAANLEFIAPAQMVWRALRAWRPDLPYHSPFDRDAMHWRLLPLLANPPVDEPGVAALVEGENEPLRRFQLAAHMARLFERYQAYRRELLDGWRRGDEADDAQAGLWRALTLASGVPSRSRLLGDYLQRFAADSAETPPGLPSRLFAFGCINVSPDVLRFLGVIGRHAEAHFFLPTPCREYWGDIPTRWHKAEHEAALDGSFFNDPVNPLLVSLGGVGREFVAQVFGYDEVCPDTETMSDGHAPARDTLLHRVQADVIELVTAQPEDRRAVDPADDSLTLHVCHSPMREAQALHDKLLDLFARRENLEPRDVAVLVADMATYAPCVDAVFGAMPRTDARFIPWTVADRPLAQVHALVALFQSLLDLPASRLGLDEVLDVVAVPAVARGCGLAEVDLDALRELAMQAGICCDEDAADRVAHGLPEHAEFSWAFGRERVLLGYMLGGDADSDDDLVCDRAPITDLEGDRAVAFGELLRVQRVLLGWRDAAHKSHTPDAWQGLLNHLLDALVPAHLERAEEQALEVVRGAVADFAESAADAGFVDTLDWRCLRDGLRDGLARSPSHQYFLAGGVSVCGMVPLRNVPFRVVCVLGLDARSFPRQDPADAMSRLWNDAVTDHRKRGDRSTREDDRYLFLQTLMAAQDVLHLSYVGKNAGDGSDIEPSVVVSELLETVCNDYCTDAEAARKALVVEHPLQPFSPRLFDASDARLFTYHSAWREAAAQREVAAPAPAFADIDWPRDEAGDAADNNIDIADLQRFFAAPQKWFLQRVVGLSIFELADAAPGREPLTDSHLARAMRERVMVQRLHVGDENPQANFAWARAHGLLPPLALGEVAHGESLAELTPQAAVWAGRDADAAGIDPCAVPLPSGRRLVGHLAFVDSKGLAGWIGSGRQGKNWLRWWIEALAVCATNSDATGLVLGRGDKPLTLPRTPCLPAMEAAKTFLEELLDVFEAGQKRPLPLPPRTAWAWATGHFTRKRADPAKDMTKAMKVWQDERADPWIATALRAWQPTDNSRFTELAQTVYGPLIEAMQAGDEA